MTGKNICQLLCKWKNTKEIWPWSHYDALLGRHKEPWYRFIVWIWITTLAMCYSCNAQCSIPPPTITASTNTQYLYSPNYPDSYPDNTACSWLITSPLDSGRIQLRVVERDFACCCDKDYLIFKDGANSSSSESIAIVCSDKNPVTVTSSSAALYGEFRSDGDGKDGVGYTLEFSYFDSNVSCPPGWIERLDFCYRIYDELLPWQSAASRCGYDGGFLTSILTAEENQFLMQTFRPVSMASAWIGMGPSDLFQVWLDGSSYTYDNYRSGLTGSGQCSTFDFSDGRWATEECSFQGLPFICKKSKDGSNGRYCTPVEITSEEGGGLPGWASTAIVFVIFFFCSFLCSNKGNRDKGLFSCICKCIGELLGAIVRCIGHFVRRIYNGLRDCHRRLCAIFQSSPRDAESAVDREPNVSPPTTRRSRNGNARVDRSGNYEVQAGHEEGDSPPSYEDTTSLPPPPSYNEALDPTFDLSTEANGHRGSTVSSIYLDAQHSDDLTAVPSYESVVHMDSSV